MEQTPLKQYLEHIIEAEITKPKSIFSLHKYARAKKILEGFDPKLEGKWKVILNKFKKNIRSTITIGTIEEAIKYAEEKHYSRSTETPTYSVQIKLGNATIKIPEEYWIDKVRVKPALEIIQQYTSKIDNSIKTKVPQVKTEDIQTKSKIITKRLQKKYYAKTIEQTKRLANIVSNGKYIVVINEYDEKNRFEKQYVGTLENVAKQSEIDYINSFKEKEMRFSTMTIYERFEQNKKLLPKALWKEHTSQYKLNN